LMKNRQNDYDILIYIEDDILVPCKAIEYWLDNQENLALNNYNLGFLRIEIDDAGDEYVTDFLEGQYLSKTIFLNDKEYCVNDINPYCAFWIYSKDEFNRFVESKYYDMNNIDGYNFREASVIGLHGIKTNWYKNTIIPIVDYNLTQDCKIYHLPNNYVNSSLYTNASIKFIDLFQKLT